MVKQISFLTLIMLLSIGSFSCGVKKPPTPLYSIPETAITTKPSPTPTPKRN